MTSRDFCYWLQGFFEITDAGDLPNVKIDKGITSERAEVIRRHLALVFKHEIDPSAGDAKHQEELNKIHPKNPKSDEEFSIQEAEARAKVKAKLDSAYPGIIRR